MAQSTEKVAKIAEALVTEGGMIPEDAGRVAASLARAGVTVDGYVCPECNRGECACGYLEDDPEDPDEFTMEATSGTAEVSR